MLLLCLWTTQGKDLRCLLLVTGKETEPQLQRKKKTPPSASSLTFYADEVQPQDKDEYMLLGNQSKFAKNVVYKTKHRDGSKVCNDII